MKSIARLLSHALFAFLFLSIVPAAPAGQSAGVYFQVREYNWKEFDGGEQLLEESGPLFGFGLRLEPDPAKVSPKGKMEGYFGEVDYDGHTFGGEPAQDRTEYVGAIVDVDIAAPLWLDHSKTRSFMLFGGMGVHAWLRDLGQENPDSGYTEEWSMYYLRAGGGFYLMNTGKVRGFVSAGFKIPLATMNHVDVDDGNTTQSVDLEPEAQPGPFIEAGWNWKSFFASVFYEYMKLEESDGEVIDVLVPDTHLVAPLTFFQPESEVHTVGVNAGMRF